MNRTEHQHHREPPNIKHVFGAFCSLLMIYQRGIIVTMRDMFGTRAFGRAELFAFCLMSAWATLAKDPLMFLWVIAWLVCLVKRWNEAQRLAAGGAQIPTWYDGRPVEALKCTDSEHRAKLFVEPAIVGAVGLVLLVIYREMRLPAGGLPTFLLVGVFALHLTERLKQAIWNRRLEGMSDARFEQEALVREYRHRYGG